MPKLVTPKQLTIYFLFVTLMSIAAVLSMRLDADVVQLLLKEGGIIETASAIGYFGCLLFLLYMGRVASLRSHWYLYVIILAMALRELDFDKRFTDPGILQSRFLTADTVSIAAKVIGGAVLLLLIVAIVTWIKRNARRFFAGLVQFQAANVAVAFAMVFIVFSKSMDGLARKLAPLGIIVAERVNELATRFEEIFELGIPITIGYAIYLYWGRSNFDQRATTSG